MTLPSARLPGGKETHYKMIVIGDPQVTNAYSPYYTSPDDNPIKKSDVERFTTQTMADIRQTIKFASCRNSRIWTQHGR